MAKLKIYQCFSYDFQGHEILECQEVAKTKKEFYKCLKENYDIKWNEVFEGDKVYIINEVKFKGYRIVILED